MKMHAELKASSVSSWRANFYKAARGRVKSATDALREEVYILYDKVYAQTPEDTGALVSCLEVVESASNGRPYFRVGFLPEKTGAVVNRKSCKQQTVAMYISYVHEDTSKMHTKGNAKFWINPYRGWKRGLVQRIDKRVRG